MLHNLPFTQSRKHRKQLFHRSQRCERHSFGLTVGDHGYEGFGKPLCALDDPTEHTKKLVGNIAGDFRLKWGAYTSSSGVASVYCLQPQPGLRSQYGTGQNIRLQEMCSLWSPCYSSSTNFIQRHQHRYSGVYKKLRVIRQRRIIRLRRITCLNINSVLRRIMEQNLIRLSARLEDVLTDGQLVLDGSSISKFLSRRKTKTVFDEVSI